MLISITELFESGEPLHAFEHSDCTGRKDTLPNVELRLQSRNDGKTATVILTPDAYTETAFNGQCAILIRPETTSVDSIVTGWTLGYSFFRATRVIFDW